MGGRFLVKVVEGGGRGSGVGLHGWLMASFFLFLFFFFYLAGSL